jgi:hypothetical protein
MKMAGKAVMAAMGSTSAQDYSNDGVLKELSKNRKRKKAVLKSGGGKYSMPVRYALRQGIKNIGQKVKNAEAKFKDAIAMRRSKADASGPTSRNKSVGVCTAGGKCQN